MAEMKAKLGLDNAQFNTGLQQAQVSLQKFNEALAIPGASFGKWLAALPAIGGVIGLIQIGIGTVKAFGEGLENAFKGAMKRQELIADFQAFYGSVEASTAKLKEFSDYSRHTSFSTDDVAEGALRLEVLTNGALQGAAALHMVGDVATDVEKSFTEVATTMGVLYAHIANGGSLDRPLLALEKMGVITPVVTTRIQNLIAAGESTATVWKVVQDEFDQFKGTTENVATTASGSLDKIQNNVRAIGTALAMPIIDALTPFLKLAAEQSDRARTSATEAAAKTSGSLTLVKILMIALGTGWAGIQAIWATLVTQFDDFENSMTTFVAVAVTGWMTLGAVINDVLTLDFSKAKGDLKDGIASMIQIMKEGGDEWKKNQASLQGSLVDINNAKDASLSATLSPPPDAAAQKSLQDAIKAEAEDGDVPTAGEIDAKRGELADMQAAAREKQMSDEAKVNDLLERRNDLLAKAKWWQDRADALDSKKDDRAIKTNQNEALKNRIAAAHLDDQIAGAQEERARKTEEAYKSLAAKRKELSDLEAAAREKTMTDMQRINDLATRRQGFLADAGIQHHAGNEEQAVSDKIEAARLAEQIGQAQESREQKIAELKQKIQEHADKLLDKEERIAALKAEKAKLDVNNPDQEIALTAQARAGEIDDEIEGLQKGDKGVNRPALAQDATVQGGGRGASGHSTKDAITGSLDARVGKGHHTMDELAGSASKGLPSLKGTGLKVMAGIAVKAPDEPKKQTELQQKMVGHLEALVKQGADGSGNSFKIPMARFGNY